MENGTQMTLEECMPETFQKPTAGVSDFLAKISQSQESKPDFKETVQACFSELCTLSDSSKKKINPLTFSLRTLKICLVLMEDGISPDCSLKWSREGMMLNGKCSTPKIMECRKIGKGVSLSDILEEEVPQKYFLSKEQTEKNSVQIIGHRDGYRRNTQVFAPDGITETLDTGQGGGRGHHVASPRFIDLSYQETELTNKARCLQARYNKGIANHKAEVSGVAIPVLTPDRAEKRQNGRRFKEDGEPMFTLTGQDRHGIAIEVKEATKQGYAECRVGIDSVNFSMPNSKTRRGRVGQEIANTLDTSCNQGIFVQVSEELVVYAVWHEKYQCYIAIRKLTPKECFRLQGWPDDYFEKAQFVNSDSQLYKQAGNGVTVTVIEAMASKMNVNPN